MSDANTQFKYTIYSLTGCYLYDISKDPSKALAIYTIEDMKTALKNGANIDMIIDSDRGYTAVFYTALYGRHDVLEELLKLGANPNARNKNGMTVLHMLVEKLGKTVGDSYEAINIVLKYGARPDIQDKWQTTAYELAMQQKEGGLQKSFEIALEKLKLQEAQKKRYSKYHSFRRHVKNRKL